MRPHKFFLKKIHFISFNIEFQVSPETESHMFHKIKSKCKCFYVTRNDLFKGKEDDKEEEKIYNQAMTLNNGLLEEEKSDFS